MILTLKLEQSYTSFSLTTMDSNQSIEVSVEERFETALLLTVARCFGHENRYQNYRVISALVYLAKDRYRSLGMTITSVQAFCVLCQRGVDFRELLD